MDNQEPNKQNGNRNNKNGQIVMTFIMVSLLVLFIMSIVSNKFTQQYNQELSYTEFLEKVEAGEIESVKFTGTQIDIVQKAKKALSLNLPIIREWSMILSWFRL